MTWSRREFVELLGSSVALLLASCSRDPDAGAGGTAPPTDAGPATPGLSPADRERTAFFEKLRRAIRTSPDHLAARADAVIATRDPAQAVRFVREQLAVLPAPQATRSGLWGTRGTLRAGAGSLRDRADVLASMLTAMGRQAVVKEMARPSGVTVEALYAPATPAAFAPNRAALDALFDERKLPRPVEAAYGPDLEGVRAAEAVAQSLWSLIPADKRVATQSAALELPERIPVVEFDDEGRRRIGAAIADLDILDVPPDALQAASPTDYPNVELAVLAAFNPPRGSVLERTQMHELLRTSWSADQLCGRRVTLSFATPGGGIQPPADPWELPARIPVLRLSDPHGVDEGVPRIAVGNLLTMFGGPFAMTPNSAGGNSPQVTGPYGPMTLAPRRDDVARTATSIAAWIDASAFPDIRLRVALRDGRDTSVDGLAAADFVVSEDGKPQSAFVLSDQAPTRPRVLVLRDGSGSTSEFLPTTAARTAFDRAIATALVTAAEKTPFDVQVIRIDSVPSERDWAAPDGVKIAAAMAQPSSSDGWYGLGRGIPAARATVAVLISDNVMTDDPARIPALRAELKASGTAVIVIPIGSGGDETTTDIVALSGGRRIAHDEPALAQAIASALSRQLADTAPTTYELRYRARDTGATPTSRQVSVALAARNTISAKLAYALPVPAERTLPGGLAGLYLKITANGVTDIRRLGGVEVNYAGVPEMDGVDAAALADAANAAFGISTVAFEPPVSSAAEMLDDVLRALVSLDPFIAAIPTGEQALEQQVGRILPTPAMFVSLFQPLAAAPTNAVGGLRLAILTESSTIGEAGRRGIVSTIDVPPVFNVARGRGPASTAFRSAMTETLAVSLRELQLSRDSAAAQLDGQLLSYVPPYATWSAPPESVPAVISRLRTQLDRYYNYHRFVASSGAIDALWIVDPATGSATAIDASGRGGVKFANPNPATNSGDCEDPDTSGLLFRLDVAAALISALCTVAGWNPNGATQALSTVASNSASGPQSPQGTGSAIMTFACVGAIVEGVYSLAEGSFKYPINAKDLANLKFAANAFGVVTGIGAIAGASFGSPFAKFGVGVSAAIGLMISAIGILGVPCLGDGTAPPPAPTKTPDESGPNQCTDDPPIPQVKPPQTCK